MLIIFILIQCCSHAVSKLEDFPAFVGSSPTVHPMFAATASCLTAYSDYSDGLEARPKFWSDTEYLAYLDG